MAQEFVIKNTLLEDKVNSLLPSQGGAQAGVDLSASTMIVPVVNLTEAAEGSVLREDLQLALSLTACTSFDVKGTTSTLINTTGYFRVFGTTKFQALGTSAGNGLNFSLTDGTTTKVNYKYEVSSSSTQTNIEFFDFIVFLRAGDSFTATADQENQLTGVTRQVADINGVLVNP